MAHYRRFYLVLLTVQKFIAKYGLAAHLAIVAVAPLFLFPFFGEWTVAKALLWLSATACLWLVQAPSMHRGELPHDACRRVASAILRDPLFWIMLAIMLVTGVRALNGGIGLEYDFAAGEWRMSSPRMPAFPGAVTGIGSLHFAAVVALTVMLMAGRHALGRSARMMFMLLGSVLSGTAAVMMLLMVKFGGERLLPLARCSQDMTSFVGCAFAVYLLAGTAALVAAFERGWKMAMPFLILALGGSAAGALAFAPMQGTAIFAMAELVLLGYAFFYVLRRLDVIAGYKLLVVVGVAMVAGALLVAWALPQAVIDDRLAVFDKKDLLAADFFAMRDALSVVARKTWLAHPWLGTGLGSFPLDVRFCIADGELTAIPPGMTGVPNCYWLLLVERGIVGAVMLGLPLAVLVFTYGKRLFDGVVSREIPHPACWVAVLALAALAFVGFFECSFLRVELLMGMGMLFALSASSFPVITEKG